MISGISRAAWIGFCGDRSRGVAVLVEVVVVIVGLVPVPAPVPCELFVGAFDFLSELKRPMVDIV